jgi:hypothetical protein
MNSRPLVTRASSRSTTPTTPTDAQVGKTSETIGAPQIDQMASLSDRTFLGQAYESQV